MTPSNKPELQSVSVEQIVTTFKRRGHFDSLRKLTLSSFQAGVSTPVGHSNSNRARVKSLSLSSVKSYVLRLKKIRIFYIKIAQKVRFLLAEPLIGIFCVQHRLDFLRAGVLDNINSERDSIFEDLRVQEKIKTIIVALLSELDRTETSSIRKDS